MGKNNKKFTYEEVKKNIENLGYELISKEYKNNLTKLILKDKYGYYYVTSLDKLRSGHFPRIVDKVNPYTIQNIKLWCKLNNKSFELISEEYIRSDIKLKWKCLKENCEEIFEVIWDSILQNTGCPYCRGLKAGLSNCLATKRHDLAKEWHPTKNGDLTPYNVVCNSNKEVWWQCSKNPKHEWKTKISTRNSKGNNCPYCVGQLPSKDYNLLFINPELCKEWDYNKNKKKPEEYTPGSGKKVWWMCEKGHEWQATIKSRNDGSNCPYCAHLLPSKDYNLLVINPELSKEWNYKRNKDKPEEYCPYSSKKVWWICKECGYEWKAIISDRSSNWETGCPECNKSRGEKKCKDIFVNNGFIEIDQETYNKLLNKNDNMYFISQKTFSGLVGLGNGLLSYDFYLPKYNLLVEYQGEFHDGGRSYYTKQNLEKQQEHDRRKQEYAENNNIDLLEIWYWEVENADNILGNVLKNN